MKIIINVSENYYEQLLSFTIRSSIDNVNLILNFIDYILNYHCHDDLNNSSIHKIAIIKNEGFRIIFQEPNKIFSICLPFKITLLENGFEVSDKKIGKISNQELSLLKRIFNSQNICNLTDPLEVYSNIEEIFEDYPDLTWSTEDIWNKFINLMTYDFGYIRFDEDAKNANGKIHPLFHFDLSYCNHATYKFGLNKNLSLDKFTDIFNPNTDQLYINL
ncbi:MAG TPA: hypothetical protein DIS69_04625 [Moraxellaceae bacterium]|nr:MULTISPECIES: hypothetical protein [unclassified Moraxella]HCN15334.1 hypothetical protein [Moraxellaceae bacterium]